MGTHNMIEARESEIRRMLGEWVSEMEPAIAYSRDGRLLGLTIAGVPAGVRAPIIVKAQTPPETILHHFRRGL